MNLLNSAELYSIVAAFAGCRYQESAATELRRFSSDSDMCSLLLPVLSLSVFSQIFPGFGQLFEDHRAGELPQEVPVVLPRRDCAKCNAGNRRGPQVRVHERRQSPKSRPATPRKWRRRTHLRIGLLARMHSLLPIVSSIIGMAE